MTSTQQPGLPVEPSARTFPLAQLVSLIREGRVRIPHFQRGLRWGTEDAVALIDSILRGFPIGSLLLWRKPAPAEMLKLGKVVIDAPQFGDALYVVDGQQRLTTLLNVFDPDAERVGDFALVYDLTTDPPRVRRRDRRDDEANTIPLPVLYDLRKLLDWVREHPQHTEKIDVINTATQRLREFHVPAYEVHSKDDAALREIYDRMNNTGKRLTRAEAFHGLYSPGDKAESPTTFETIQREIGERTKWGSIDLDTILLAFLARRGHDISRDIHNEFSSDRRKATDFPAESNNEAHKKTLESLEQSISFLKDEAQVPHYTFLPDRFLLVVLSRFFAHFPAPHPRNLDLLRRAYWRIAMVGSMLAGGGTATTRTLTQLIQPGDENGSTQRLIKVTTGAPRRSPQAHDFRTNKASGKLMLCALWALGPRSSDTGEPFSTSDLTLEIGQASTPASACPEVFRRDRLPEELRNSLGNRVIAPGIPANSTQAILRSTDQVKQSHCFDNASPNDDPKELVRQRESRLQMHTASFLERQAAWKFDDSPPLDSFDFDEEHNAIP